MSSELRQVTDRVLGATFGADPDPGSTWGTIVRLGWHRVGVDESVGGVGGDLADVVELATAVGRHAVTVPLLETASAGWALAQAGVGLDVLGDEPAVVTVEAVQHGVRLLPLARNVVLVGEDGELRVVPVAGSALGARTNVADEPVGDVTGRGRRVAAGPTWLAAALADRLALIRAAALAGCVERATRLVAAHVATRHQFGRPLVSQQAVAHGLAVLAGERDLIAHAVEAAVSDPTSGRCTAARAVAARGAGDAARAAHQLMGAMGITREHPLQLVTRRIWAWRDDGGSQRAWEHATGERVVAERADDELWDLTAPTEVDESVK